MKLLAVTLVLLPLIPSGFSASPSAVAPPPSTQPVVKPSPTTQPSGGVISVHRGTLSAVVDAQGYFEPIDPFEVRFRPKVYTGELTITSIVPDGSTVKQGDTILELDPVQIDKALAAAENEDLAAHAGLTRMEADTKLGEDQDALALKMQTDATKQAQDAVRWFENVDGPHMLLNADLGLKYAKATVDDQQDELDELKKMYKSDDLSTDTADIVVKRSVRALEMSKASYQMEKERVEKIKTYIYPAQKQRVIDAAKQAEQQLDGIKIAQAQTKVLRETNLKNGQAGTLAVDEKFKQLKGDRAQFTFKAPADGIVAYGQFSGGAFQGSDPRSLKVGEHIAPNQIVMTFYTPGKLRVRVDLPETKFFLIHAGTKVHLTPAAFSDMKMEGTCDACPALPTISPQGPVFATTISPSEVDAKLVPGMRVNLHADASEAENVLLVPNSAIRDGAVWRRTRDGQAEKQPVVVGKSDGKQTEIKQGLKENDDVYVEAPK